MGHPNDVPEVEVDRMRVESADPVELVVVPAIPDRHPPSDGGAPRLGEPIPSLPYARPPINGTALSAPWLVDAQRNVPIPQASGGRRLIDPRLRLDGVPQTAVGFVPDGSRIVRPIAGAWDAGRAIGEDRNA